MTQNPYGVVFVAQPTCFQDPSSEFCVSWPIQLRQHFRNGTPVRGFWVFAFFLGIQERRRPSQGLLQMTSLRNGSNQQCVCVVCLISQTTWTHLEFDGQFVYSTVGRPQTKKPSRRSNYYACPMTTYRGLSVSLTVFHPDSSPDPTQPNPTWPPPTLLNSNWVKCFNGTTAGDNLVLQENDFPARLQLKCSVIAYCFICRESAKKSNQTYPHLFFHDSEQHAIRKLMKLIFKMVKTWKEWEKYSDKVRNWILIDFW